MSKKVLKSFADLEEGMKVYVRDDLVDSANYGCNVWAKEMKRGEINVGNFEKTTLLDDTGARFAGYRYTNEMIDWDKTNEINGFKDTSKQQPFITLPQIKVINSEEDNEHFFGTFIQIDEKTIIYTESNTVGVAHCHPDDEFNLETGKALAFYRWTKGE